MIGIPKQIPLDLNFKPAYERADLFVGASNREAVLMLDSWPNWAQQGVVLYGEEGSGKRHLAHVWQGLSAALNFTAEQFQSLDITQLMECPNNIIIQQLHLLAGDLESEEKIFHLYNQAFLNKKNFILFTSRIAPARLVFEKRDVLTRLTALPNIQIDLPSEDLIAHILGKQIYDHGMVLSSDLLEYAASLIGRSWNLLKIFVEELHTYNLTHKKPITQKLIREILQMSEERLNAS